MRGSEGGQMCLIRRLPKVGFRSKRPIVYQLVNLQDLTCFKDGTVVEPTLLVSHGLIKDAFKPFKILGQGDIKKALTLKAYSFSKSAQEKIVNAGGKIEVIDQQKIKEQNSSKEN